MLKWLYLEETSFGKNWICFVDHFVASSFIPFIFLPGLTADFLSFFNINHSKAKEKTTFTVFHVNTVSFHLFHLALCHRSPKKATGILYNKHPDNAAVYAFCHKDSFYLHVTGIQTNRIMTIVATCVTWADIQHAGIPSTTAFQRVCNVVFFNREMLSCSHAVKGLWLVGPVGGLWRAGEEAARQAVLPSGGRGVCGAEGRCIHKCTSSSHGNPNFPIFLFIYLYFYFCILCDFVCFISLKHTLLTSNPCVWSCVLNTGYSVVGSKITANSMQATHAHD